MSDVRVQALIQLQGEGLTDRTPEGRERLLEIEERLSNPPDLLMFVGSKFYPTAQDFIKEAMILGVSKRIGRIPDDVVPGRSRVFLVHDDGVGAAKPYVCPSCDARYTEREVTLAGRYCNRCCVGLSLRQPRIFGFFVISHLELVLDDPQKVQEYQAQYQALDIRQVTTKEVKTEPRRGCGHRIKGGVYLVSTLDPQYMEKVFDIAEPLADTVEVRGGIVVLLKPIPYWGDHFRGWKYTEPWMLEGYDWPQKALPVTRTVRLSPQTLSHP